MLPLLAALALPAAATSPSLLKSRPSSALVNEIVELRPVDAHHFNVSAPQSCGGERPFEVLPRRLRCQMKRPGAVPVLVSVCDDARAFCRQERFDVSVRGPGPAASASPMAAAPKGGHRPPPGFLDNEPDRALALARRERRLLFIDFYGIWCPPCNELEEQSYPSPAFRAESRDFVKLELDADAPASYAWKSHFRVGGYPTLIVADADLREIGRVVDYRSGPALAKFLDECRARRAEPVEEAARRVARGGRKATAERRLRVARWRAERGEFEQVEALLSGLASDEARKVLWTARREKARLEEDAQAGLESLRALLRSFPEDASYAEWASALAEGDATSARALEPALQRSVERWSADPSLGEAGYDPGDLLYDLAAFLDDIGSTKAAKGVWSRAADAYAEQAALSPLTMPRAANIARGEALMRAGRTTQARALYRALVAAYPREFTFNYKYASVLEGDGAAGEAYPYAVAAVAAGYGDNWLRAVRLKAEIELALGRSAEAAKTIEEALAQSAPPTSTAVRTYRYLADLRALQGKIAVAGR